MNSVTALKTIDDQFEVEYEVLSPIDISDIADPERDDIRKALEDVDAQIKLCENEIAKLSVEIDRLTNHADGLDYAVAVACGIISGLIDSFFVKDYNPNIEDIVTDFAKKKAKKKGDNIENYAQARSWLEDNYHVDHDGAYNKKTPIKGKSTGSNGHTHRLDDLAHHPTLMGLAASIFFQFFRVAVFVNKDGKTRPVFVKPDAKQLAKVWLPAVMSGIMLWLANVAENYSKENLGDEIPIPIKKIVKLLAASPMLLKVLKCADTWYSHIMSDVASKQDGSPGKGIPGIFLSLLKEISIILPFPKIHNALQEMYKSKKFNFDNELVIIEKLKKQAMPVLINEVIVRTFYFTRRLISEYKKCNNLQEIEWINVMPFGNRTVERMMTIASGTFMVVDIADAAIRSGGFNASCILRVNFVGIGRFVIALGTDVGMGIKRNRLIYERIGVMSRKTALQTCKVYYKCAQLGFTEIDMFTAEENMWIAAQDTEHTLIEMYDVAKESAMVVKDAIASIHEDLESISDYRNAIEEYNPGLIEDVSNILKWGKKE